MRSVFLFFTHVPLSERCISVFTENSGVIDDDARG